MNPSFSVYLHVVRFISALIVFVHHASYERFDGLWLRALGRHGHEAVMVFFVLSGFVIAFVTHRTEKDSGAYWSARISRLASVALPCIALTYVLDAVGSSLNPETYGLVRDGSMWDGLSFIFLNQIWLFANEPGTNIPFWSLSYEFCFYLLFGIFTFSKRPVWYCVVAALLIGPKILLLFPAWWLGVYSYKQTLRPITRSKALIFALGGIFIAVVLTASNFGNLYINWRWRHALGTELYQFIGRSDSFVADILIAASIAVHFVGMSALLRHVNISNGCARVVRKIADSTFCIYLAHYPALYFFSALSVFLWSEKNGVFISLMSLLLGFLLVRPTELFRSVLRLGLERKLSSGAFRPRVSIPSFKVKKTS